MIESMVELAPNYNLGKNKNGEPFQFFVIDDSAAMIKIISRAIDRFGGQVCGSTIKSTEALERLKKNQPSPDIITLDINMPDQDGLSLIRDIKKQFSDVKIIMVSAMGNEEKVKEAIQLGASHFVVKPFNVDQLYTIVKSVCNR